MPTFIIAGRLKDGIEKHEKLSIVISYRAISFDYSDNFRVEESITLATSSKHKLIRFYPDQIDLILATLQLTDDISTAFYPHLEYILAELSKQG